MAAAWGDGLDGRLRDPDLPSACADAGATRLQVNISDDAVAGAMRIAELTPPIDGVISIWADEPAGVLDVLSARVGRLSAWAVEERAPLNPVLPAAGRRIDALSNVAFLRRPPELSRTEWLHRWLDDHTQVAIDTQATFGYYQNVVLGPLTDGAPPVDAIVEELFPMAAVSDPHAFYGSGGDQAELEDRLGRMLASVARFGADRNLDVVPTSRFQWEL
nr:EthD domain-containing protein [Gordonia insulae]